MGYSFSTTMACLRCEPISKFSSTFTVKRKGITFPSPSGLVLVCLPTSTSEYFRPSLKAGLKECLILGHGLSSRRCFRLNGRPSLLYFSMDTFILEPEKTNPSNCSMAATASSSLLNLTKPKASPLFVLVFFEMKTSTTIPAFENNDHNSPVDTPFGMESTKRDIGSPWMERT